MNDIKIKKVFNELNEVLLANKEQTVESIYEQLVVLMQAKKGGGASGGATNFVTNSEGKVVAQFCYYHKKWELVDTDYQEGVEYGFKASSPTGYNNMCKEGTSKWTSQNNEAKRNNDAILDKILNGEISREEAQEEKTKIEQDRGQIVPREDGHGWEEKETMLNELGLTD